MNSPLILVDGNDRAIGAGTKLQVHLDGVLHRAFSVFVFDRDGRMLLQRRAIGKYHSGGLWSNACCGHPAREDTREEAKKRLAEEMGFSCELHAAGSFVYKARVSEEMIEYEYDHLYLGRFEMDPTPDPREVDAWAWIDLSELMSRMRKHPHEFSAWFMKIFEWRGQAGLIEWSERMACL